MKTKMLPRTIASLIALMPALALAFNSGSTGADGAFNPTVSQQITLPDSGVFNYTSVNIPAGVTISYKRNAANTPVVILATGDVNIAGILWISASASPDVGAGGNGNVGDDGLPGYGGPGGYNGGQGGTPAASTAHRNGGNGLGPGGGGHGNYAATIWNTLSARTGGGGGFSANPGTDTSTNACAGVGGASYGSSALLPLIGGSGGGGGAGGSAFTGSGGGGGGGAVLIAASGTINVSGNIYADGGAAGTSAGDGRGAPGGGGAGGAVRLVATTVAGNGGIFARGGTSPSASATMTGYYVCTKLPQADGSAGRVRIEAENMTRTAASNPAHSFGAPGLLFVAGLPTLRISSVAGVAAPPNPTGNADITLPSGTANPVTVTFATTGVPVGNTVKLTVTPSYGAPVSAISPAITGTTENGAASVTVSLPTGPSVLMAQTTYTIVAALGDALSRYAGNERVEKITLTASLGQPSTMKLITVSGKTYDAPAALLATMGTQG